MIQRLQSTQHTSVAVFSSSTLSWCADNLVTNAQILIISVSRVNSVLAKLDPVSELVVPEAALTVWGFHGESLSPSAALFSLSLFSQIPGFGWGNGAGGGAPVPSLNQNILGINQIEFKLFFGVTFRCPDCWGRGSVAAVVSAPMPGCAGCCVHPSLSSVPAQWELRAGAGSHLLPSFKYLQDLGLLLGLY